MAAGCGAPRYIPSEPVKTDGLFGAAASGDTTSLADISWDELFTDPGLRQLIGEGLDRNLDLKIAEQRVREAEAYLQQSAAGLFPDLSVAGRGTYGRNSESIYPNGPRESKTAQLGFESGWEIDIWGKLRSSKRAYYANLLYSNAGRKAVQTRLIADIATTYYRYWRWTPGWHYRGNGAEIHDLVETMKVMKDSGKVTGQRLCRARRRGIRRDHHSGYPAKYQGNGKHPLSSPRARRGMTTARERSNSSRPRPSCGSESPHGSSITARCHGAKYQVMQAYEITRSARAGFYPSLRITASSGLARKLDDLFESGFVRGQHRRRVDTTGIR